MLSGLEPGYKQTTEDLIKRLGHAALIDDEDEATHVVAGPKRTRKVLFGLARGSWIVAPEWLLGCLQHNKWVGEEKFERKKDFTGAALARKANLKLQPLLRGKSFIVQGLTEGMAPADLQRLIEAAG